jgi:hypothetical protein
MVPSRRFLIFWLMLMALTCIGGSHVDVWVGNIDNTFLPYAVAEFFIFLALILSGTEVLDNL